MTTFGELRFVARQDLAAQPPAGNTGLAFIPVHPPNPADFDPHDQTATVFVWPLRRSLLRIAPTLLLVILTAWKARRNRAAWGVLAPVALIAGALWSAGRSLPADLQAVLQSPIWAWTLGVAVVFLTASGAGRIRIASWIILTLAGSAIIPIYTGWVAGPDLIVPLVFYGIALVVLRGALSVALRRRFRFRSGRSLMAPYFWFALMGTLATPVAGLAAIVVAASWALVPPLGAGDLAVFAGGGCLYGVVLGAVVYTVLLPFVILAFRVPYFGDRLLPQGSPESTEDAPAAAPS